MCSSIFLDNWLLDIFLRSSTHGCEDYEKKYFFWQNLHRRLLPETLSAHRSLMILKVDGVHLAVSLDEHITCQLATSSQVPVTGVTS